MAVDEFSRRFPASSTATDVVGVLVDSSFAFSKLSAFVVSFVLMVVIEIEMLGFSTSDVFD